MRLETFRGRTLHRALAAARAALGEDAMLVRTRRVRDGGEELIEVVATTLDEVERLRRRLEAAPRRDPRQTGPKALARPRVVALVGPTGAGKTTTLAKLALHAIAYGSRRVGLITLDSYRVGALEQIQTYADIAQLPVEVVYTEKEALPALERLKASDIVLIDTPGRSPRDARAQLSWRALLRRFSPDEVHLVLPAIMRADIALATRDAYAGCGLTHVLLSKLDEVPNEEGVAELAERLELPARWVADGQEVPVDLRSAGSRIIASLSMDDTEARRQLMVAV